MQKRWARESLIEFARIIQIPGVPLLEVSNDDNEENAKAIDGVDDTVFEVVETELAQHHILICDALEKMVNEQLIHNGETVRRVMFMLPPGSAKSTYASVVFPAWIMGNNPNLELILTGYGDVICKRHGKRTRQLCASPRYQAIMNTALNPQLRAADDWGLLNSAGYKASGILSGITGFRCDGLIWDDLTKGRKEADSETIRNDTYNAYLDDARSRKKPRAWEVGIGTRWHEDEHMGRILPEDYEGESGYIECRDGNVWYVICLAAECERHDDPLGREIGEMIWPEWFTEEYWRDKRVNPRSWASLYQQRPSPDDGIYFKSEWIKHYVNAPDQNIYISFDGAVTAEDDNPDADETAIQVWGVDHQGKARMLDEWVRKCTMDVWVSQLITMVSIWKPLEVIGESGVIRRASEPYLSREMRLRRSYAVFEWVHRNADKQAMARSFQAMCSAGMVEFPEGSIGDAMIDEMLRFPTSKKDNRVDAAANFFLRLEEIWEANPPAPEEEDPGELEHGMKISDIMPPRFSKHKSRWSI